MHTIVLILILLTAFNFLLKQTFWKPVAVGAATGIATIFVILLWPYAIEQSKTQIADWLSDNQLMLDTSVVLTLEIVVQMAFCLLAVHVANYSPVKNRMMVAYRLLYWFPGVLIIPVLFFGLTQAIFSFPGISFKLIAWLFGLFVFCWVLVVVVGLYFFLFSYLQADLKLPVMIYLTLLFQVVPFWLE